MSSTPMFSAAQRDWIAADHDRWADGKQAVADRLAADGKDVAAGTFQRGADECREIAEAARTSSEALENAIDPF